MVNNKYFTVKVRPTITPSLQQTEFDVGDILFDWTAVQIPRGTAKLVSATAIVRPKGDAGPTANPFAMELYFADDDRVSLGTINGTLANTPTNDLLGMVELPLMSYKTLGANTSVSIARSGASLIAAQTAETHQGVPHSSVIMTPKATLDVNRDGTNTDAGYSTFYVGGIANGDFNFVTINAIAADAVAGTTVTCDGTDMSLLEHFAVGDIVATANAVTGAAANVTLGTVKSVDSATVLTLTATSLNVFKNGSLIVPTSPIEIILAFEY